MALAAAHPHMHRDEDAEETVPVSSWAKQGLTAPETRIIHHSHLIQYGPLTAQGNFLSQQDGVRPQWHQLMSNSTAAAAAAMNQGVSSDYYNIDGFSDTSALPLADYVAGAPPMMNDWNQMDGGFVESSYDLYTHHPQIDSASFQTADLDPSRYGFAATAPLSEYTRQMPGPWDGIWAFNPDNVAENFVYPSNDVDDASLAMPSLSTIQSDTTQLLGSDVLDNGLSMSPWNGNAINSTTASPGEWVVVSGPSPPHSEPSLADARVSPPSSANPPPTERRASDTTTKPKTSKPERTKRNKTMQVQLLVPRRQGPLSVEQRQKADDMRYYGACWRCRRYKKPCNGPGDCDTCKTSGFRVWPSTIGCYRGNMEDFISGVMPGNAELIMQDLHGYAKKPNWKVHFGYTPDMSMLPLLTGSEDRFVKLQVKLQATRMAGQGFIELVEIVANYQRTRTKPDICLEHACEALSYICDVYHAFVQTDTSVTLQPKELLTALTKFRSHYSANWRQFLALCLSGRRGAWFPAFLCATINVPLLVVLKDGFVAIPEPTRSSLWPNISFLIEDLRNRLYPMGLDLLAALSKNTKPWKLQCWNMVPAIDRKTKLEIPGEYERNPDGLRLLGGDVGAFDGFQAVQAWLRRHTEEMYHGVSFLTTPPFSERNAKMQPIAALAWIFEVAPPGKKVVDGKVVDDVDAVQTSVPAPAPTPAPVQEHVCEQIPVVSVPVQVPVAAPIPVPAQTPMPVQMPARLPAQIPQSKNGVYA